MKTSRLLLITSLFTANAIADVSLTKPIGAPDLVFEEKDGFVAVEAEHFFKQDLADVRAWYLTTSDKQAGLKPDADGNHVEGAGRGAYLEALPDTRKNHGEKLIRGENFFPEAGKAGILSYKVHFNTPGKYYVWARTHSTGTEDNGLHVGLNNIWPESGQRMQWTKKKQWAWGSKQRTQEVHVGVPGILFLEIPKAGEHTIHFSMREDGFEFDSWIMTQDADFKAPDGAAPTSNLKGGKLPDAFPVTTKQTSNNKAIPTLLPTDFPTRDQVYLDQDKWFAVNPDQHKSGKAAGTWPFREGTFDLTLHAVGEDDGQSSYELVVDGEKVGSYTAPLGGAMFVEGEKYLKTFKSVILGSGSRIEVTSNIGSKDGDEFSRARWSKITVKAADNKPLAARAKATVAAKPKVSFEGDQFGERMPHGNGDVAISGELKNWHKVILTLDGPFAHEKDNKPNAFTDYRFDVTFTHASGTPFYKVPGYFAADGNAGETSAESGTKWRALFAPDKTGDWTYKVSFKQGEGSAIDATKKWEALNPFDGKSGTISIAASDKSGRDLRGKGRLQYVGKHHLQFAGSGEYFVKAGADAPETFLGYADFDGTVSMKAKKVPLKTWEPHLKDWKDGDPTWKDGKGKGMIGAINYLSGKGCNVWSFLTYNAGGDGDNVWPFIERNDKFNYDCSKLDQWGKVFDHGTAKGMYLHFKLQETENDDNNRGHKSKKGNVPTCLDNGDLGPERKLYLREIIARFGHNLALNWNLGEENTQSTKQQQDMAQYIADTDPYNHLIVIHSYPDQQDKVYRPLLGKQSALRGASLQNSNVKDCHKQVVKWNRESAKAGVRWVVGFDEPGTAGEGMPADPGYPGMPDNFDNPSVDDTRKYALWGTLMAGGSGVEYYFGYKLPQNDLVCEDWRSRDLSWDYCNLALSLFRDQKFPIGDMVNADELVGNPKHTNEAYCYAKPDELYLVYLPNGGKRDIDLPKDFQISWFNPREGGMTDGGAAKSGKTTLIAPDSKNDWLAIIR